MGEREWEERLGWQELRPGRWVRPHRGRTAGQFPRAAHRPPAPSGAGGVRRVAPCAQRRLGPGDWLPTPLTSTAHRLPDAAIPPSRVPISRFPSICLAHPAPRPPPGNPRGSAPRPETQQLPSADGPNPNRDWKPSLGYPRGGTVGADGRLFF